MNIIGENVRKVRESNGWTQEQLAAKCNLLKWNISRSTLAKIESKVRRVTDIEVKTLSEALGVNIEALFFN
ncbi:MAG: helix-turn-helix domain-containing protein [Pseudoalteromonas sp.]|uniref:XRE family transcriptional regulator n=1 Tax=Vibrio casei TaxID=673372 RepID=A0A368LPZ8_9VIBR|nr:helix-turn-helix transcriptional regulator [Vibrio casei]RCS73563.1 XRE family transcriptional regulator [Vibrio casei]SJN30908.1 putative immunity repressor protein [Vibrio casei]